MTPMPMPLVLTSPETSRPWVRDAAFQDLLDDGRVLAYELCTVHAREVSALNLASQMRVLVPHDGKGRWLEGHRAIRDADIPGLVEAAFVLMEGLRDCFDPEQAGVAWLPYNPRPYDDVGYRCLLVTRHALVVGTAYPEAALERELRKLSTCLSLAGPHSTAQAWQEAGMDVGGLGTMILQGLGMPSAHARLRTRRIADETFAVWLQAYPEWADPVWRIGPPQV